MAKIKSNPAIGELTGTIGNLVFAKHKPGEMIMRQRPIRRAPKTKGEIASQQAFAQAVAYAKNVWIRRPELRAKYEAAARRQGRQGFHLAKADFRRPPTIAAIELDAYTGNPAEVILIDALDDFEVESVQVAIRDLNSAIIEEGAAILENSKWTYRAVTAVPAGRTVVIDVTAKDHPGHTVTRRVDHACGPRSVP